jgi:DNA-binding transcriptional LysR family regulator
MRGAYMIDLRSLRHLVVLARQLNYVRAADELGVTQPTLSRSIQALERQLGLRLFDRDRRGVNLTPQGRLVAERAAFLLVDAEDLERQAKLSAQGEHGRIRLGMAPMPARTLLTRALTDRLKLAPNVTHEVVVRDVEALWAMLVAGEIEFFVSPNPPIHHLGDVNVEVLGSFPFSLIVRAEHPLMLDPSTPERFPLLRSSWTGISVPREIERYVLGPPNVVEDFAVLAGVTAATNAVWLSSAYAIDEELRGGSLREFFRAEQQLNIVMYSLKRRSRSAIADAVAGAFREQVRSLTQNGAEAEKGERRR